jgi:hypothetical protein
MKLSAITTREISIGLGNSADENFRIPTGLWHRMVQIALANGVPKGRGIHW